MSLSCRDLKRALREGEQELPEALLRHVEICPACTAQLQSWKEISATAQTMQNAWESPHLWPRISRALAEASSLKAQEASSKFALWDDLRGWVSGITWQPVGIAILLVAVCLWGTWSLLSRYQLSGNDRQLLTEQALREIEAAEQLYVQSIEKLAGLVPPQAVHIESPLLASYHEKLLLVDAAIADCRSNIEINRFNAHLRRELLSMYQEKQSTLQEFLKEEHRARN